jgi:hypothetical protein
MVSEFCGGSVSDSSFRLKVRIGNVEVELGGGREEVMATLDDLDLIVDKVSRAFSAEQSHVKAPRADSQVSIEKYPNIQRTTQCSEAVEGLLESDWGKTPRAIGELRKAMEANAIFFPKTTLSGVLVWMVKKGSLRRWKDNKRGYLYMLNVEEAKVAAAQG